MPYTWSKFLEYITNSYRDFREPITWKSFISQTGRDRRDSIDVKIFFISKFFPIYSERETQLRDLRERNHQIFDSVWGHEEYVLVNGMAVMESYIFNSSIEPRVFSNWRRPTDGNHSQRLHIAVSGSPSQSQGIERATNEREIPTINSGAKGERAKEAISDDITREFRTLVLSGRYDEAHSLGLSGLDSHRGDALYLLELGVTQFFRGEYASAFDFCSAAVKLAPQSSLVNGCIGLLDLYDLYAK